MVKFKYIAPKDWEDFVTLKVGRTYKERKYGIQEALREEQAWPPPGDRRHAGKLAQWEQEDRELADAGIANPWDQFPGCSRNFMCARGRLVISEGEVVIIWETKMKISLKKL